MMPYLLPAIGFGMPIAYVLGPRWVPYYVKQVVFYSSLAVVSITLAPYYIFLSKNVENMFLPAKIMMKVSSFLGLEWEVKGTEKLKSLPGKGGVIVSNHQNSLDLFGMFMMWPVFKRLTIVAKESLKYAGPFGLIASKCGIIFIDRKKGKEARDIIQNALNICKTTDTKLLIFPEGTRHHDRHKKDLLPFKSGAFAAAIDAQVPIIPVVFSHYDFLDTREKIFEPANIIMTILDPISTLGMTERDVDKLTETVRFRMLQVFRATGNESEETENIPEQKSDLRAEASA